MLFQTRKTERRSDGLERHEGEQLMKDFSFLCELSL